MEDRLHPGRPRLERGRDDDVVVTRVEDPPAPRIEVMVQVVAGDAGLFDGLLGHRLTVSQKLETRSDLVLRQPEEVGQARRHRLDHVEP